MAVLNSSDKAVVITRFGGIRKPEIRVTVDRKLRSKFTANGILKEAGLSKSF
jgi:hypothetical protein